MPEIIAKYNKFMEGVDMVDQKAANERNEHSARNWCHVFFFHCLNVVLNNGYIIWKSSHPSSKISSTEFRLQIADSLIPDNRPEPVIPEVNYPCGKGQVRILKKSNGKGNIVKDCVICKETGIRTRISSFCSICNRYYCARITDGSN